MKVKIAKLQNSPGLAELKANVKRNKNMIRKASIVNTQSQGMLTLIQTGEILTRRIRIEKAKYYRRACRNIRTPKY